VDKEKSLNYFRLGLAQHPGRGVEIHSPPETGTTWRRLRGRGRSWETGTSCGCLDLAGVGNGYHPGVTSGTWEELGNWHLVRVLGPDGRPRSRVSWETGQPGKASRARPPPSHIWRGPCPIVPKQNAPPTNDTPAKGCRNEHAGQHRDDGKPSGPAFGQVTASRRSRRRRNPAGQAGTPLIKCIREAHVAGRPGGRVGLSNHGKKAARCQ